MKRFLLLVAIPAALCAQTTINGTRVIKGTLDASGASSTLPNRTGTGSPVGRDACAKAGETYFQTDASSGQNIWLCTATGTPGSWTPVSGSGVSVPSIFGRTGAVTAQSGDYTAAQITNAADTTAANTFSQPQGLVGGASLGTKPLTTTYANDSSTGTSANKTIKLSGAPSHAVRAAITDTAGIVGICVSGCGTTSTAEVATRGAADCVFDGATTAGDYIQNSSTVAGDCHDAGASYPSSGQVLGRVLSTNASAGTYSVQLFGPEIRAGVSASEMPALTGDVTSSGGSTATTLATVNASPGACGDASHVCQVTTNAKGLVTAQSPVSISGTGISSLNGLAGTTQAFANDTNVTISSAGSAHTLGWNGLLGLDRGGLNADLSTTGGAHQVLQQTSAGAAVAVGQLAAGDISGLAASATTDATNASNLSSGTLAGARLPSTVAQTNQNNTFTAGTQDLSAATHTLPVKKGTAASIPATCTQGELYFATDASAGRQVYECDSTNHWTQEAGGGAPGGTGGQVQYNSGGSLGGFSVSGDGTLNTSTGALMVTKTNGTTFAASATTDTTNAGNISSGTLGAARLPALSSGTEIQKGNGSGGFAAAAADTDYQSPVVRNVKSVGAVCNGVADDSAPLSIAATTAGIWYFPANATCVAGNLYSNTSNVTWIGNNTTIKHLATDVANYLMYWDWANHVHLSGFNLDMNGVLQTTSNPFLIQFFRGTELVLDDITVLNSGTPRPTMGGVNLWQQSGTVRNVRFANTILANQLYSNGNPAGSKLQVLNSSFSGTTYNAIFVTGGADNSFFEASGNTFSNITAIGGTGEYGNGIVLYQQSGRNRISGNQFYNMRFSGVRNNQSSHVIVDGNQIVGAGETAIYNAEFGGEGNVTSNNIVTDSYGGITDTNIASRTTGEPAVITNNVLYNIQMWCIHIENATATGNSCTKSPLGIRIGYGGTGYGNLVDANSFANVAVAVAVDKDLWAPPANQIGTANLQNVAVNPGPPGVALNLSGALSISAITNANPAIITYSGTQPTNGQVYLIAGVYGMTQVNQALCTVASSTASTFACSNVNSTSYSTYTGPPTGNSNPNAFLVYSSGTTLAYALPSTVTRLAASATTDTTNASNISNGTLGAARLPRFTGGDVTSASAGSAALTLGTVNSTPGSCGDATHVCQLTTDGKGRVTTQSAVALSSGGQAATYTSVTHAASVTFTVSSNTVTTWALTLGENTTAALSGAVAGSVLNFKICQPASGGPWTFTWPTGFSQAPTIALTASACTKWTAFWDGSAAIGVAPATVDSGPSVLAESTMPTGNPPANFQYFVPESSAHMPQSKDSSGNFNSMVRTAASRTANRFVTHVATTGIPATAAIAAADLPAATLVQPCEVHIWGSGTSSVLQDTDDETNSCLNTFGATLTITAVACWADTGSPTVTPVLTAGGAILTGAITCNQTEGGATGTLSGTPTQASNKAINMNVTTAGGTAHEVIIYVKRTL